MEAFKIPSLKSDAKNVIKMDNIEVRRKRLEEQARQASVELEQLEVEAQIVAKEKIEYDKVRKSDLITEAEEYENAAKETGLSREDVHNRLRWAKQARADAVAIFIPGVDDAVAPVELPEPTSISERLIGWLSAHGMAWSFQIVFLALIAWFCYDKVVDSMHDIQKINAEMQAQGRVAEMLAPPVDDTDLQQLFFDKLQLITDVGFGLFILLVMAPHVLITIIPFIKEPKNLWKPFFELPERDKQWLAFAWSALVLLVTIYSHPHK